MPRVKMNSGEASCCFPLYCRSTLDITLCQKENYLSSTSQQHRHAIHPHPHPGCGTPYTLTRTLRGHPVPPTPLHPERGGRVGERERRERDNRLRALGAHDTEHALEVHLGHHPAPERELLATWLCLPLTMAMPPLWHLQASCNHSFRI